MTKKEFAKLKVGDKVRIKKYEPNSSICWVPVMDKYIGKVCTISFTPKYSDSYFAIKEDNSNHYFHYKAIDKVVVGAVATKNDNVEPAPEERIKQLEAEIKSLKEESKKSETYKFLKKGADEAMIFVKAYTDAGFTREEAMKLIFTALSNTKFTVR